MTVSVLDAFGGLEPLVGTDPVASQVAELQFLLGQGPSTDAVRSGDPVMVADLTSNAAYLRWPLFVPEATVLGVRSLHAFPLGPGSVPLGAVAMYRRTVGALDDRQLEQAVSVTELVTLTLVHPDANAGVGAGLRMTVHQAAGMVMQQTGTTIRDALVLIKATSFAENRTINDLAADIVAGGRRFTRAAEDDGAPR